MSKNFVLTSTIQVNPPASNFHNTHFVIIDVYPVKVVAKFRYVSLNYLLFQFYNNYYKTSVRSNVFGNRATFKINEGLIYIIYPFDKVECYELITLLVPVSTIILILL